MPVHRIHLKGPWGDEWIGGSVVCAGSGQGNQDVPLEATGKIHLPATWRSAFGAVSGTVRLRRRFGCPTNLDETEQVFLVFNGVGGSARFAVNDVDLGAVENPEQPARFEVTQLLQPNNILIVEIQFDATESGENPGGLWGPVAIEIRSGD